MEEKVENTHNKTANNKENDLAENKKAWWQPAMALFLRMSSWIVVPVIIAAFIGKWLDKKYNTEPWILLVSVGFSFLVSMIGIVRIASKEYKKVELNTETKEEITK